MYVQYKVNVSENQVYTLKDAIRLKKGLSVFLLLTQAQINQFDKAQVEGRRVHICLSARQVAKNVSYTRGFIIL